MQVGLLMTPPHVPSALSGVLSYRKREHVCCGTLTHYLYDRTPLVVDQELHLCPDSTAVAPAVGLVASLGTTVRAYTISRGGDERVSRIVSVLVAPLSSWTEDPRGSVGPSFGAFTCCLPRHHGLA